MNTTVIKNRTFIHGGGRGGAAIYEGSKEGGAQDFIVSDASPEKLEAFKKKYSRQIQTLERNLASSLDTVKYRSSDFICIATDNAEANYKSFVEAYDAKLTTTIFTVVLNGAPYQFIFTCSPEQPEERHKVKLILGVLKDITRASTNEQVRKSAPSYGISEQAFRNHAKEHMKTLVSKSHDGIQLPEAANQVNVGGRAYPLILVPTTHMSKTAEALVRKTMPHIPRHTYNLGDSLYICEFTQHQIVLHQAKITHQGLAPIFKSPRSPRQRPQQGKRRGKKQQGNSSLLLAGGVALGAMASAGLATAIYTAAFTTILLTD